MKKRPLLFGVLAFVIGEWTGCYPYMAMGLGMAGVLYLLWYMQHRSKRGQTMPFSVLFGILACILGMLNAGRCRLIHPIEQYMEAHGQETVSGILEGRIKRVEYRTNQRILIVQSERIVGKEYQWNQPCTIKLYEQSDSISNTNSLCIGNEIRCEISLKILTAPTNPGEFDARSYYRARGIDFLGFTEQILVVRDVRHPVLQLLTQVQQAAQQMFAQYMPEEQAGIMGAMLLGNTGELDSGIRKLYQRNGIAHILAISALHISIIGGTLYQLLRKLGASYPVAGGTVMMMLILYGWMTGFSSSTLRAVIMFGLMLAGDILGRTYDMLTAAGLACLCILIENPWKLSDAGFLLSFSAVLSLGIVAPLLQEAFEPLRKGKMRRYLIDGICSSLVLQLMTGPIVAYFYYDVPVYGVLLNIIVIPLMTPLVAFGCSALLLYPLCPWLGSLLLVLCGWILNVFQFLCRIAEALPGACWHTGHLSLWNIGIYYACLFLLYILWKHRKKFPMLGIGMVFLIHMLFPEKGPLVVTMLDVGQGDGIFIETPNHRHILIDGGSSSRSSVGAYILTPAVKYYGAGSLDYVFVSHMDQDHVNGIQELIAQSKEGGIPIRQLVVPEAVMQTEEFQTLLRQAEDAGISVTAINSGEALVLDSVSIRCLYPLSETEAGVFSLRNTEGTKNNNSMVVSLSYGAFDMLFTGDLEAEGEEWLLNEKEELLQQSYDVLKVGHHGSDSSSTMAFLERLQPDIALISCGRNNSYGHPHAETLDRLAAVGSRVLCTVDTGAIEIQTDGRKMEFHFYNADDAGL
ncbi:MAG: DNA internalization-related competence protein ComEC/Rec2 [Bacteroides sp.]|nr:DNA internalization-related competence protein ComEC/Rec2 [Bacteroides sp.]MCM1550983.1 DNA internalization-related competence protein ComEC/Rec2 [Clostridium sp.]